MSKKEPLAYLRNLKVVELRQIAKSYDIAASGLRKEEIVQKIISITGKNKTTISKKRVIAGSTGILPLHMAVLDRNIPEINRIIDSGFNVDRRGELGMFAGRTAYDMAILYNYNDIARVLAVRGASQGRIPPQPGDPIRFGRANALRPDDYDDRNRNM